MGVKQTQFAHQKTLARNISQNGRLGDGFGKGLRDPVCFELTIDSCCRASKWHHATNLFRDMCRFQLKPDIMCVTAIIESMVSTGNLAGALAFYREAGQLEGESSTVGTRLFPGRTANGWDLHGLSGELARMAVRMVLLDTTIASEFSSSNSSLQSDGSLHFIVGLGQHSKTGESTLGPSVLQMLEQELGLQAHLRVQNEGLLRLPKHEVRNFATEQTWAAKNLRLKETPKSLHACHALWFWHSTRST